MTAYKLTAVRMDNWMYAVYKAAAGLLVGSINTYEAQNSHHCHAFEPLPHGTQAQNLLIILVYAVLCVKQAGTSRSPCRKVCLCDKRDRLLRIRKSYLRPAMLLVCLLAHYSNICVSCISACFGYFCFVRYTRKR